MTHPRGRLPARVYWVRRGMVLAVIGLLVFGVSQLFGGGGTSAPQSARLASAPESTAPPPQPVQGPGALPTHRATPSVGPGKHQHAEPSSASSSAASTPQSTPLAQPSGPCDPADLSVKPAIRRAAAGTDIPLALELTGTAAACNFKVSPDSLVVKVTSGHDRIWSTQDCPGAVPKKTVVVRSGQPTEVAVQWGGHRSTPETCSGSEPWAQPGYYHAHAAVLGSVPTDHQFRLTIPPRKVITKTTHPKPEHQKKGKHGTESACAGDMAC